MTAASATVIPSGRARRPRRRLLLAAALLAGLLLAGSPAAARDVPPLAGRVNDLANVIPPVVRTRLDTKLQDVERRTGAQIAVLTVDTLGGDTIEDFAVRVFQAWRLGRRGIDDGVLLVVAHQDRRMRIEVGYGLEGRLTDALSRQILDERLRPRFRAGDFGGGIEAGVDAIAATVEGVPLPKPPRERWTAERIVGTLVMALVFSLVIGTFSLIAVVTPGGAGWFLYLFLVPFYAIFPSVMFPPYGGAVAAGTWLVVCPLLRWWLASPAGKKARERNGFLKHFATAGGTGSGGGRWGGGGSSGGGGGFSGGGGSSGGGGASSSW